MATRLRRLSPVHSVRGQMVLFFLLLTLLVLFLMSAGLLVGVERSYTAQYSGLLKQTAAIEANQLSSVLQTATADITSEENAIAASGLTAKELPDGGLAGIVVLNPADDTVIGATSPAVLLGEPYPWPQQFPAPADLDRPVAASVPVRGAADEIWAAAPVRVHGRLAAIVVAEYPLNQIYLLVNEIRAQLPWFTLGALVVSALISYLLALTFTGPIGELTRRSRAMAAGDLATRLPVHGPDEVGQLAIVLNHMARRLQETLRQIRAEQGRAAAVLQNMTDGILVLDAFGHTVSCNPAAVSMLHLDPTGYGGRPVAELVPPALASVLAPVRMDEPSPSDQANTSGFSAQTLSMVAFADRWIQVRLTPLVDDGEVQGSVVVLYDVTARERLEAMRKELVANVSHELRTPITTVKLYVESLLEWGLDDPLDARQKLHVVADEVDRMARLINDLLELSKLDDRKIVRNRQSVDIRTLCRTVQERFDERAQQKGVRIIMDPSAVDLPEERFRAEVDADRILQVLTNLVSNSLDFTSPGGEIRLHVGPSVRDRLSVTVSDTGVGIPARDLPRIFDRFYRVEGSRSREHGGSGLGLAIAKEIVEAHGGTIDIESQEGVGTTIRFTLPQEAQP